MGKPKTETSWFSADVNTGEVVAKTDMKSDGSVRRYDYTVPDQIDKGHGDKKYDNLDDFLNDNPSYTRDKNAKKSINRRWKGPGYDLALDVLNNLSLEEWQELLSLTDESYIHTSDEMFIKGTQKQLILK